MVSLLHRATINKMLFSTEDLILLKVLRQVNAHGSLKIQDAKKIAKKTSSAHHRTTLSGYIFATKAYIDNRKNLVKQQYLLHM